MIYFIGCNDRYVKIGVSYDPYRRIDDLQVENPYELTVLKTIDVSHAAEVYLHNKFSHLHHRGEWFHLDSELREYIATEAETDLRQFQQQSPYSKAKHPILFVPKKIDGSLNVPGGFSLDSGRIYSAEGIARFCVLCDLNPKDFEIWHNGVRYKNFDNEIFMAAKKFVGEILQND